MKTESLHSGAFRTRKHHQEDLRKPSGAHLTDKHPELKNAKPQGKHETGKSNHPLTSRKLENFPEYVKGSDVKLEPSGGNSSLTNFQ